MKPTEKKEKTRGETMKCKHANIKEGPDRCFSGPVNQEPYTFENRAAHGGISYTETCRACGMKREINSNMGHVEYGIWREEGQDAEE